MQSLSFPSLQHLIGPSDGLTDGKTDTGSKRLHWQMWQALLLEAVFSLALAFHPDTQLLSAFSSGTPLSCSSIPLASGAGHQIRYHLLLANAFPLGSRQACHEYQLLLFRSSMYII
jgi:hypothetical protein